MNCLIDNALMTNLKKGKKLDVIRRYIRMKYRISIDHAAMLKRIKYLNAQSRQVGLS